MPREREFDLRAAIRDWASDERIARFAGAATSMKRITSARTRGRSYAVRDGNMLPASADAMFLAPSRCELTARGLLNLILPGRKRAKARHGAEAAPSRFAFVAAVPRIQRLDFRQCTSFDREPLIRNARRNAIALSVYIGSRLQFRSVPPGNAPNTSRPLACRARPSGGADNTRSSWSCLMQGAGLQKPRKISKVARLLIIHVLVELIRLPFSSCPRRIPIECREFR